MRTILLRHGKTAGNLEGRYIGRRTDEPLCEEGVTLLKNCTVPKADCVFSSPLQRCVETGHILYSDCKIETVKDFEECDFGDFEGYNYKELNGREDYQKWIDSNGEMPFPNGESRKNFAKRCVQAYDKIRMKKKEKTCAFIVHGGTIMAIMEKYANPAGNYFDFQVKNGHGYILEEDGTYTQI